MTQATWFSIVIPVFNREQMIVDALDSVRSQTYRPIQLIVVDDGSTDSTGAAANDWITAHASMDLEVAYVHQENAGPSAARNRGIREIHGDYVQFFDSDDRMHPKGSRCWPRRFRALERTSSKRGSRVSIRIRARSFRPTSASRARVSSNWP